MLLFRPTNNEKSQSRSENCSTSEHVSFDMRLHHLYTHQFNTKINQPLVRQQKQKCEISDVMNSTHSYPVFREMFHWRRKRR